MPRFIVVVVLLILITILFYSPYLLIATKDSIYFIFSPFLKSASWLSIKIYNLTDILSIRNLFIENNYLKQENSRLAAENARLKEIEKENVNLKKALNSDLSSQNNLLPVDISAHYLQNIGRYGLINKGARNNLKKDLIIIDENGALIGKITEVNNYFSKILLITDPGSLINAIVQNEKSSQGIVRGDYGLTLLLDMVPAGEIVEIGQAVVTTGTSDIFPRGLLIGAIEKIIFHENDVFQKALIKPAVDFNRLDKAFVIIP